MAFAKHYSKTKSGYEAMCEIDETCCSYMALEESGLITSVVDALWPDVARNYKISGKLTRLGYLVAQKLNMGDLRKIDFDSLPAS